MAEKKPGAGTKSGMNVDTALVRELAELLSETGLTEIEVEDNDRKIRVARNFPGAGAGAALSPAQIAAFNSSLICVPWTSAQVRKSQARHGRPLW